MVKGDMALYKGKEVEIVEVLGGDYVTVKQDEEDILVEAKDLMIPGESKGEKKPNWILKTDESAENFAEIALENGVKELHVKDGKVVKVDFIETKEEMEKRFIADAKVKAKKEWEKIEKKLK